MNVKPSYYVVTPEDLVPVDVFPGADINTGLACLIEQEVLGRRNEQTPRRLGELLQTFGFEWEPLSEPGHMRFLGHAAHMLARAKDNAANVADSILQSLDILSLHVDGVSLVDPSAAVLRDYIKMTSDETGLYGDSPYQVASTGSSYMLRQTSCFQKFSACLDRSLAAAAFPAALFEISDSFRREPEDTLQLSFRLRRFHLPEAHIHTRDVRDAAELSLRLHPKILQGLSELEADLVLLISATHEFAARNHAYLKLLAGQTKSPALLKVSPPGEMCQDGIEVDVEYKIVDSAGCCRELSTFQIDERITSAFGVRCDDGTSPATIHSVFTGGVERYLYFALDRTVRSEAAGVRRHLPLWLSPVVARVVAADVAAHQLALSIADRLHAAGIRTEFDDRGLGVESAIEDADSLLVPYVVLVGADPAAGLDVVSVREFDIGRFGDRDLRELIAEIGVACALPRAAGPPQLSRQPFQPLRASEGVL